MGATTVIPFWRDLRPGAVDQLAHGCRASAAGGQRHQNFGNGHSFSAAPDKDALPGSMRLGGIPQLTPETKRGHRKNMMDAGSFAPSALMQQKSRIGRGLAQSVPSASGVL